jgi:hypothetical protein
MITIRTCSQLEQAEVMKSFLQGSGIESFIADESAALSTGSVRLQVGEEDAARAEELLRGGFPLEETS